MSNFLPEDESLEDLWTEAQTHRPARKSRAQSNSAYSQAHPRELFTRWENWRRTRGVALLHAETQTLLGQFSEYLHSSEPGCRRLIRETSPISVEGVESVSGDWWIGAQARPEPRQSWTIKRPLVHAAHLPDLEVWAPAVELVAHISLGAIARVELGTNTLFSAGEGAMQLLHLPAGTNILPVLSLDDRIAIRRELGL